MKKQTLWPLAVALTAAVVWVSGCGVRYGYGPEYYDSQQCRWVWVPNAFGGFHQLQCWNPYWRGFRPYVVRGAPVYAYPPRYYGPRVRTAPPPVSATLPPAPPRGMVPAPAR